MVKMETNRLVLRDYKETDLNDMHRLWSDKETMFYLDDILCNTIEDTIKYLQIGMANTDGHYFCICEKGTDRFIGSIGYTIKETTPLGKIVHMGYMLMPEYHGRGYMTEATKKVIEFAFTRDDCVRITTGCIKEHEASSKVMEKAGFRKEAERSKAQYHDGIMKDRLEYAINKDDFETDAKDGCPAEMFSLGFWSALDRLVAESKIIIDRPKSSRHPKYPDYVYPLDYGYLENTSSPDGGGIDIWKGTDGDCIDAIICTVDLLKRDSEIKILLGCSEEEKLLVAETHNNSEHMKGILIQRGK